MKEMVCQIALWATAIGTAAAGYFALTTYMDSVAKQVDERKVQVFNLHSRFSAEPMLSTRRRVYSVVLNRCPNSQARPIAADDNDLFTFVEFFDVVEACVEAKLCDSDLVDRLFVAYANGHWPHLKAYVASVRRGEIAFKLKVPFGTGLERLARNPADVSCPTVPSGR